RHTISKRDWSSDVCSSDLVREALNRSLNTVAWQVLEDIGIDTGLNYLGAMEFQRISYVDNGVASLSIGGFTNGTRVVDMAKGYKIGRASCRERADESAAGE